MSGADFSPADPGPQGIRAVLDHNPCVGPPRTGAKRFWTVREVKALKETFPAGGIAAALAVLPGRTAKAIYVRAAAEGLRAPKGVPVASRTRWTTSPQMDDAIRRTYAGAVLKRDVRALATQLGRPEWWVSRRAGMLGLVVPRFRAPPWTDAEDAIIRAVPHLLPRALKARLAKAGFARTESAILSRLKRLGESTGDPDKINARGLAQLMGVNATTVLGWIEKGWLTARRAETHRGIADRGGEWRIKAADVRRFVIDNAAVVDLRKVDRFWFIDMMAGGR